jgi:peptide/nickel transport system substrate-binding protein
MSGISVFGLLVGAALMLSGAAEVQAGKQDDTLNVAFHRDVRTVDGLYATNRESDMLGLLTDDPLFYVAPGEPEPVPLAAQSYTQVDDTTFDIVLRDDVLFHDGSPLTAEDVAYSYMWLLNPDSGAGHTSRFQFWLDRVEVLDQRTVRFHLKRPYPMILYDLAYYSRLRKKGTYDGGTDSATLNGTGPYRVVSFDPGRRIVLERFEAYRSGGPKGEPQIGRIVVRTIPDWGTQAAEVMSGGIDWTFQMPTEVAENIGATGRAVSVAGSDMRIVFMTLDAKGASGADNPLTKLEVRRAINHAIDRKSIVEYLVGGRAEVLDAACNPQQFGCTTDVISYDYDPAKARQLLADAGYADGFDVQVWATREKPVVEAIAGQLAEVGIRVDLRFVKSATLGQARREGITPIQFTTWGSWGIPDVGAIAPDYWLDDSDRNFSGDAEIAALVAEASSTYDPARREQAFHQAFRLAAERAYWVPLYTFTVNYALSKDVDFTPPEDGMVRLFKLRWND